MPGKMRAADLYCGAGGTSEGARQSGAADVVFALNHWDVAVETHSANFPDTQHVNSKLEDCSPSVCPPMDLLFASPECTHFSRARGGKPTSDQQRAGAFDVLKWIDFHRPTWLVVENVKEFREWGPVGKRGKALKKFKGRFFDNWIGFLQGAGYRVDWQILNAADYGAATSRERMFVVARKGNREPVFPTATHSQDGVNLPRWRPAHEVIDWSIVCPSIFGRERMLADNTLLRIEAGLRRFVGPFISAFHNGSDGSRRNYPLGQPLPTQDTSNRYGVAVPFVVPYRGEREGQTPRTHSIEDVMPTITTEKGAALAMPFLFDVNHGEQRHINGRTRGIDSPLPVTTGVRGAGMAIPLVMSHCSGGVPRLTDMPIPTITANGLSQLIVPFLLHYYGTMNLSPTSDALDTITTKERHGMVECCLGLADPAVAAAHLRHGSPAMKQLVATMRELHVGDVGFRMLVNAELAAAQGFPAEYIFAGNKGEVTKQIGNSVSPDNAKAITLALAAA